MSDLEGLGEEKIERVRLLAVAVAIAEHPVGKHPGRKHPVRIA
jgi:hypothetical protein